MSLLTPNCLDQNIATEYVKLTRNAKVYVLFMSFLGVITKLRKSDY